MRIYTPVDVAVENLRKSYEKDCEAQEIRAKYPHFPTIYTVGIVILTACAIIANVVIH